MALTRYTTQDLAFPFPVFFPLAYILIYDKLVFTSVPSLGILRTYINFYWTWQCYFFYNDGWENAKT